MILWLDLETTGLDHEKEHVLEVAAIMTDDKLAELGRFHAVTDAANWTVFRDMHPYVQQMHFANGLWMESLRSTLSTNRDERLQYLEQTDGHHVDSDLYNFILELCPEACSDDDKTGPQLGGNTISFDRAFMRARLPLAHRLLHYRNIDVTGVNELARRFWPAVYGGRPRGEVPGAAPVHRAMADVEVSLATARYYTSKLGSVDETAAAASDAAVKLAEVADKFSRLDKIAHGALCALDAHHLAPAHLVRGYAEVTEGAS